MFAVQAGGSVVETVEGPDRTRSDRRYSGGVPSAQCPAMRLLYPRHADDGICVCCRGPAYPPATRSAMRCRAITAAVLDMKRSSMRSRPWPRRDAASSRAGRARKPAHERTYLTRPSEFLHRPLGPASQRQAACWPVVAGMSPTSFCRECFMSPMCAVLMRMRELSRSTRGRARMPGVSLVATGQGSCTPLHAMGRHHGPFQGHEIAAATAIADRQGGVVGAGGGRRRRGYKGAGRGCRRGRLHRIRGTARPSSISTTRASPVRRSSLLNWVIIFASTARSTPAVWTTSSPTPRISWRRNFISGVIPP